MTGGVRVCATTTVALLAAALCGAALASPQAAVAAALADVRRLPAEKAQYTRYLTLYAVPERDQEMWAKATAYHVNELSREADLLAPRRAAPLLLAIDIRDYGGTFTRVYEKLADVEPYFHATVEVTHTEYWPGGDEDGRYWPPGNYRVKKKKRAAAPWLPTAAVAELIQRTQSQVPIVRADWFFFWTSIQANRKGTGYYDFLGLKSRDDYERLIGLDVKAAQKVRREVAAIIRRSGVAQNNRQVFRFGAIDAGAWQTRDVFDASVKGRNAIRNLDDDFIHDAEEWYGFLPNRLFAFYLSNANGDAQDTAPDKIGPDTTASGNDGRIHVCLSCVRCHVEGIRPLGDYARRLYRGSVQLQSPDYDKLKRLRQLYLGPLEQLVRRDREDYAEALASLTGWKPAELSAAYKKAWRWYADTDVDSVQAARELGVTPECLLGALKASNAATGQIDPVLAAYLKEPPETILRDQWEEVFSLAATLAAGFVPGNATIHGGGR